MTPADASRKLRSMSLAMLTIDEDDLRDLWITSLYQFKQSQLRRWRNQILERDEHCCRMCGNSSQLEAHHCHPKALYPDMALLTSNGVTLCFVCHRYSVHGANSFDLSNWQTFIPLWDSMSL